MSQLHVISQSPFNNRSIDGIFNVLQSSDTVLLINDGTYLIKSKSLYQRFIDAGVRITALVTDMESRGLKPNGIETVDMNAFVKMSFDARHIISWF